MVVTSEAENRHPELHRMFRLTACQRPMPGQILPCDSSLFLGYGEFGEFYIGMQLPLDDLFRRACL